MPNGYLWSWIFNFLVFFPEFLAFLIDGDFLYIWVHVGLWGGLGLGAFPWFAELIYITVEYPERNGKAWEYIFWSAEFWMLSVQGILWTLSLLTHALSIVPILNAIRA